jgi:erythromycin esterase-like protein/predicted phosphoribosyltransferase
MNEQSAFWLEPTLVRQFVTGKLDTSERQARLADQVARLMPLHAELPGPLVSRLTQLIDHLGGEQPVVAWLDRFPGQPRKVARLLRFVQLLDRFHAEPAVVTALIELRRRTSFPLDLRRYLAQDINTVTLATIGWHVESLLAQDEPDEALRLALATAEVLKQVAPRVAQIDPAVADLDEHIQRARQSLLEVVIRDRLFRDRRDAGRVLAGMMEKYRGLNDVVVLGLSRGGVPVAYEVATALGAQLDVFLVRKLGLAQRPEVAMGAIASNGVVTINDDVVRGFGVLPDVIREAADQEGRDLDRRERIYREGRAPAALSGRTVIIVDDGLATGASIRAAIQGVRAANPARLMVAIPAAPESTCDELALEVDDVICATTPSQFFAVSLSYWDFIQTSGDEVSDLLRAMAQRRASIPREPTEVSVVRSAAVPADDKVFLDLVGNARFVLIGGATHGTHEFYAVRARMTRRLIEEKGFLAVAVEADWPDAYQVNRYVHGHGEDMTAEQALRGFRQFPAWMWRNSVVLDFVSWLREHNTKHAKAGFYGLDLFSMHKSADEVITYLAKADPAAAAKARERYSCFDHADGGRQQGLRAAFGAGEPCERAVLEQLADIQRHAMEHARRAGLMADDEVFYAEQNARLVMEAERYYRAVFGRRESSWNLRDRHMADTLDALADHLGERGTAGKIVVWAHNSHLGDARATEMFARGELTVGQLVRERHPTDSRLIGFTTYAGTVTAASHWGGPVERKQVRPALEGSVEDLFHQTGLPEFMLTTAPDILDSARLQRVIGVIYRPGSERPSHYYRSRITDQFDAVVHIDKTRAVEPLERTALWVAGELPETYPHAV